MAIKQLVKLGEGMALKMDAETMDLAESQAALCGVFANPKRVLILWSLDEEEKAVTAIAQSIDASLQSTSQHLKLMKEAGILQSRRDGQTIYYHIANNFPSDQCLLLANTKKNRQQAAKGLTS